MKSFKQFLYEGWFESDDNTHLKRRESIADQIGTPKLTKHIKKYMKDSKPVNSSLISGKEHPDTEHIDEFINSNRLLKKLHVYSALGNNAHEQMISNGFTPSYLSSTPHKTVAQDYASKSDDGHHHIAHIELPEGSAASHLGGHENEVLIGRGQKLNYQGTKTVEDGKNKYKIHKFIAV